MKLDDRITELVAIGASVTANCLSCLEYHVGKATENGVAAEEIADAIDVGKMVRKGAAGKMDKLVESLRPAAASPRAPRPRAAVKALPAPGRRGQ
jgi:AhpD family alkylhydroperoxidase